MRACLRARVAVVLEALQALTTDRSSSAEAAFYSVCGVLAGALIAELSRRAWKRFRSRRAGKYKL
jgi:hypothetical protein